MIAGIGKKCCSLLLGAFLLVACNSGSPPSPPSEVGKNEFLVFTREGPTVYGVEEISTANGFEHDLVQLFAAEIGKEAVFKVLAHNDDITVRLRKPAPPGEKRLGAAWLSPNGNPALANGPPYAYSENIIVQHEISLPIIEESQLSGKTVYAIARSRQAQVLREMQKQIPGMRVVEWDQGLELDLLEDIAEQKIELALVDSAVLDIATNFFPNLQGTLSMGEEMPVVWLLPAGDTELRAQVESFFARIAEDGTLERLKDRYFGHVRRLRPVDVSEMIRRMRTVLPQYRDMFREAQAKTGIDWRLLAALAYQESHWNPLATSYTGVRGMMMLTGDTADHMGVTNRLDPKQSIHAGSEYLASLRQSLPDSVPEPDRTWMAVAAYNLGMGHMNGGRSIAKSLNKDADSWYEMKAVLPLLSRPQYYQRLKAGRARGGEAVVMTENVRVFYDILRRYQTQERETLLK
ncbi:MAG: membrane-bound lytic murein transglycosylase MltF [Betaproteobacteria bacterium]|nr:membrane-bound lytic murein transglycosylase MltF [Betaproteobacteria bacterium]